MVYARPSWEDSSHVERRASLSRGNALETIASTAWVERERWGKEKSIDRMASRLIVSCLMLCICILQTWGSLSRSNERIVWRSFLDVLNSTRCCVVHHLCIDETCDIISSLLVTFPQPLGSIIYAKIRQPILNYFYWTLYRMKI